MLMFEAMQIINGVEKPQGFMVHFERKEGCVLASDYFPDKHAGESLIETEEEAWTLAKKFADRTTGKCINIYVVTHNFVPVRWYRERMIENRTIQYDSSVRFTPSLDIYSNGWRFGEYKNN